MIDNVFLEIVREDGTQHYYRLSLIEVIHMNDSIVIMEFFENTSFERSRRITEVANIKEIKQFLAQIAEASLASRFPARSKPLESSKIAEEPPIRCE